MKNSLILICLIFLVVACSKNKYEPSATCDLSQSKYSADIKPIIENNCSYSPCHASQPLDSTLTYNYTSYEGIKRAAGSIYDRINRPVSDPLHMPKGLPGDITNPTMDSCELAKLNIWILNGAAEN